ncbi:MAG: DUF6356 family protein [Alphaproteobacteria bacterium]
MRQKFHSIFLSHPRSVDETYVEHFRFALGFSGRLFLIAFAALVHALIPCLFEKTASNKIKEMHGFLTSR